MKFEAVIFDLFGTLVDDFGSSVGQMQSEFAAALNIVRVNNSCSIGGRFPECERSEFFRLSKPASTMFAT